MENKSSIILCGDALDQLRTLETESINTCVTSPPYYNLRDYGTAGQIGMEATPDEYIQKLILIFREVRRVLRPDGTLWLNIGDSYAGSGKGRMANGSHYMGKPSKSSSYSGVSGGTLHKTQNGSCKSKDLIGIPWMLAFALRSDGWYLRQDIIWQKTNSMPESVQDRCTRSHEYIFLLSKSRCYFFDAKAIREPVAESSRLRLAQNVGQQAGSTRQPGKCNGPMKAAGDGQYRNKRDVWTFSTGGFHGAHFAVFPEKLAEPCILAGCPENGTVLDPFAGSGTTGVVAKRLRRNFVGVEINSSYCEIARGRIAAIQGR